MLFPNCLQYTLQLIKIHFQIRLFYCMNHVSTLTDQIPSFYFTFTYSFSLAFLKFRDLSFWHIIFLPSKKFLITFPSSCVYWQQIHLMFVSLRKSLLLLQEITSQSAELQVGWFFFSLHYLNTSLHSILVHMVSKENLYGILLFALLYLRHCFCFGFFQDFFSILDFLFFVKWYASV